jgi:hypothetical protein
VKAEARAALASAGAPTAGLDRLAKLIDMNEVHVDDDGTVNTDDITAQIDELKDEFPELFRRVAETKEDDDEDRRPKRRERPAAPRIAAGNKRDDAAAKKDAARRIAELMTGGRG